MADLGCGPGHVAAHLTSLGVATVGIDLSAGMIKAGRQAFPQVQFRLGSLLAIPADQDEFVGAVCFYSVIHLQSSERPIAYAEMARVIRPGWAKPGSS